MTDFFDWNRSIDIEPDTIGELRIDAQPRSQLTTFVFDTKEQEQQRIYETETQQIFPQARSITFTHPDGIALIWETSGKYSIYDMKRKVRHDILGTLRPRHAKKT